MDCLIDSHCHLTCDGLYEQVDAVLDRAAKAGVERCMTIATNFEDAERAFRLSATYSGVHAAVGIHPHEANRVEEGWDETLRELIGRDDVYAVGETGLDYHYDFARREDQARVFRRQLELAENVGKPVVIHCREAIADALAVLGEYPSLRRVVFHCFTGTTSEAERILKRGYWISLTGVVTFKKSDELRAVARLLPADRLMVETDAPYLSPEPVRDVRPNEPAHLVHTAACIARERDISVSDLAVLTSENARRFFGLPDLTAKAQGSGTKSGET